MALPAPTRRDLREALAALEGAETWSQWQEGAEAMDALSGMDAWRADDESPHYDASVLRSEIRRLAHLRARGEAMALAGELDQAISRHIADINAPELYGVAFGGTKRIVTDFLDECEAALRWLVDAPIRGMSTEVRRERFAQAWRVYGRSALMLSGGATWGFFHLGVVKALFEHGLLPHILSGASTGAMVAAGICARTDAELADLFAHPEQMRLDGLKPIGLAGAISQRAMLDPAQLDEVLRHNIGEWTFAEAYARSGRVVNIPVSPTRSRQKPRVLSYLTAPDVLLVQAVLASSALPGFFPPVVLEARDQTGNRRPYLEGERWVDGSIYEDLPKLRLARLHNVNHFIVSQTNPHVMPFVLHEGRRGLLPALASVATSTVRTQGAYAAELASKAARPAWGPLRQLAERTQALWTQDYKGDIDIHPRFRAALLKKVVMNPSPEDLRTFIYEGERSTWQKLSMIKAQTRLGRVFRECLARFEPAG